MTPKPATSTNWKRLIRQIHYWVSLAIFIPCGVMIAAGIFLMVKKDFAWIQPPTLSSPNVQNNPNYADTPLDLETLLASAHAAKPDDFRSWDNITKIDIRPSKSTAKLISDTGWEAQIDLLDYQILSLNKRRSDLIESLHDGSFFAPSVKRFVFLPTGILLLFMWASGAYLFLLPYLAKAKKSKRGKTKRAKKPPCPIASDQ